MAPMNFYDISREQLLGIRKILRPSICGNHGLKFLTTALLEIVGGIDFCRFGFNFGRCTISLNKTEEKGVL